MSEGEEVNTGIELPSKSDTPFAFPGEVGGRNGGVVGNVGVTLIRLADGIVVLRLLDMLMKPGR